MTQPSLPYPPLQLANRVGCLDASADPMAWYDELGRAHHDGIVGELPQGWTFAGKRVLDFGCGAGRTLRQFTGEAVEAEVWGCDIDEASIHWLRDNVCPPFHVLLNGPEPPLDQPDSSFDLIWGVSVFTHLVDSWSRWLVELHRLLRPDGLLFLTFMGQGTSDTIANEPWDEEKVGMNALRYAQSWDVGGPMVMHSPWWIKEHWGRAFEILSLHPDGFGGVAQFTHGSVLMRKRDLRIDAGLLEQVRPDDSREAIALAHNVRQLRMEVADLRVGVAWLENKCEHTQALEAQVSDLEHRVAVFENSRSWNLTKPLRSLARWGRGAKR